VLLLNPNLFSFTQNSLGQKLKQKK
jgi:hypothetical protein